MVAAQLFYRGAVTGYHRDRRRLVP
jgi:hypothetical protein